MKSRHFRGGAAVALLYDPIMKYSVFPRKFGAGQDVHREILRRELADVHGKKVLEVGTGTGSAAGFLPADNLYTGTDVGPGLLRRASRRFARAGFRGAAFHAAPAESLCLPDGAFDVCLCVLSLNFFDDLHAAIREIGRVLAPGGVCVCCVPVPERNIRGNSIRGAVFSEADLKRMFHEHDFSCETVPRENGALLYFRAVKKAD